MSRGREQIRRGGVRALATLVALSGCGSGSSSPPRPPLSPPPSLGPGFVDITPTAPGGFPGVAGPGKEPISTAGVMADLDGDGAAELVLSVANDHTPAAGRAHVYRFDPASAGFVAAPDGPVSDRALVLAAADFDGDGRLDLLTSQQDAQIVWGAPGATFGPATSLASAALPPGSSLILAAALEDLDDDGWLDVLLGNQNCCPTCQALHPFLRTGPRAFTDRADLVADNPMGGPYAVLAATLDPGGRVLGALGDGCGASPPAFFRASLGDDGLPRFAPFDPSPPGAVFRRNAERPCPSLVCRSPMAAAWGDLDGDGQVDLAVSLNSLHAFFQGGPAWPLADRSGDTDIGEMAGEGARAMIPWGSALLDLDRDGRDDVVTVHGDDHEAATNPASYVGPQHATVHWNGGGFRFADVTPLAGLGRRGQWRSLFVGDLDRDGDPDLVVGGTGEAQRVYRNDIAAGHAGLALRLRGSSSNALGLGARVTVWPREGGAAQLHVVAGVASPHVVSEALVFVGLGESDAAARVRVVWPSGTVQEVRDLRAGAVHDVVEPALFELAPASRHLPADGVARAVLRVTPRALDGSVRSDARVEVAVAHGAGRVEGPPTWDGAAWVARVVAPTAPGSGAVVVRVDGVAAGVRPRLWWD